MRLLLGLALVHSVTLVAAAPIRVATCLTGQVVRLSSFPVAGLLRLSEDTLAGMTQSANRHVGVPSAGVREIEPCPTLPDPSTLVPFKGGDT